MAVSYTKERLQKALKIFREARERSRRATSKVQRHLRNDYQFRRVNSASNLAHVASWDDADASSDEYNPETPKKRRPIAPRTPKPKRLKQNAEPANPTHTTLEKSGADIRPFPSLLTLRLSSPGGKLLLDALAGQHGTGYEKKSNAGSESRRADWHQPGKTYLEKQDEESAKIGEGLTRSGLKKKIDAPIKTRGCTACKQAKKRCSARISRILPCKRCESEDLKCVEFGSDEDSTSERHIWPTRAEPKKPVDAFVPTVASSSSQPNPSPSPALVGERPIDQLRRHFVEVQEIMGNPVPLAGMSLQNPITLDSPSPPPEPLRLMMPSTYTISTPWAHPINFKYPASSESPCHFCNDFRYGIYGYGLVEAEVSRKADGQLHEHDKGHTSQGREATRMCVECSLKRIYISRCKVHSISQFGTAEDARFKMYIAQLLDKRFPNGPAIKLGVYYTCSLCTQPAFWRCVADQTRGRYGNKLSEEQGNGRGCGLFLCKSCTTNLQADHGVLKKTTVQKPSGHDCRRADMQFLFPGSLLHKAYN